MRNDDLMRAVATIRPEQRWGLIDLLLLVAAAAGIGGAAWFALGPYLL